MQTANPFRTMWQKVRLYVSPLDGFSAFYLGLESGPAGAQDEALSADLLLPAGVVTH